MSLGKRIQSYRKQKGLSQEQLASRLNISRQALSKWESDINVPNIDKIMDVAKALEITLNELLGLEEDSNDEYAKLESILNQVVLTQNNEIIRNKKYLKMGLVIGTGIFIILALVMWSVLNDIKGIKSTIGNNNAGLSNQINIINNQLSSLENSLFDQLQEQLQAQGSLLSSFELQIEDIDFKTQTMKVKIDLVVKNYEDTSSVVVVLDYEHYDDRSYLLTLSDGHFKTSEDLPIDNILNAAVTIGTDSKQAQLLKNVADYILPELKLNYGEVYEIIYQQDSLNITLNPDDTVNLNESGILSKYKKDNKLVKFDGFYYLNDQKHTVKVTTDKQRNILFSILANDFKNGDKLKIVINLVDKTGITSQIEKNFIVAIIDDSVSLYEE